MIRFAILGAGWRAAFFLRVAKMLPEMFSVAGVLLRNREKGKRLEETEHVPVFYDFDELMKETFDFAVVAYPWEVAFEWNQKLFERQIPVLSETPIAPDLEAVDQIWEAAVRCGAKVQVAEQYFAQPYHSALLNILCEGKIGVPTDLLISMVHGYHAVNLIRRYLDVGFMPCTISAKRFSQELVETCGRDGLVQNGALHTAARDTAVFTFENGKNAYFDFCEEQYFSGIRSRFLRISGTRGEIFDRTVRYLNEEGDCACSEIQRVELGQYSNLEGDSLRGLMLDGRYIYRNPFAERTVADFRRLSDEELALAKVLLDMKTYVETGKEFYGLAEACQDTYLSHCLTKALETGKPVQTERKPWYRP
ncbi:Gfo/Idh/MocA family protein [Yeguia hominis]|uniref:Gfo/Idh/MocA family oxidoreductase n=1 Tax=Yeguia hominis TaxID=2763662 RepID=A0A926HQ74_9FIRM|nr:Gfo/Idh/MocA family oxidoreductase [Yeguia hominis]MBC8532429.1 Gfo/Idh/MocA family oxidoreductase [Yeguia hominis]